MVRVAAILLRIDFAATVSNHPRRGPWPRLPLLVQGGEPLGPGCAAETSLGEMGLVLLPVLLYDGFFLIRTSPKTELVADHGNPSGFISVNKR